MNQNLILPDTPEFDPNIEQNVQSGFFDLAQVCSQKKIVHEFKKHNDIVFILGFAPDSLKYAPLDALNADIWALNELYLDRPHIAIRATAWFQLHGYEPPIIRDPHQTHNLGQLGCPILMWRKHPGIHNSVPYPLHDVLRYFDVFGEGMAMDQPDLRHRAYFTNSISWMLALAIMMEYKEIHVYGVNMAQDQEYCVGPDTKVLTADLKWIPAKDLEIGDELLAYDEEPWDGRYRRFRKSVVQATTRLTRPCYKLEMEDGTTLISSAEHRWLINSANMHRWVETEKLRYLGQYKDNRSSHIVKVVPVWTEDKSFEAGYLAGAFDGEGHIHQAPRHVGGAAVQVGFSQNPNKMSEEVEMLLRKRGYSLSGSVPEDGTCYKFTIAGGRSEVIRFLGQIRPPRLLEKFDPDMMGTMQSREYVPVKSKEFIGEQEVIGLGTTTGTFIAEGFASHNSHQRPSCEFLLGWARGMGIRIYKPPVSDLLMSPILYGYDDAHPFMQKLEARRLELMERAENSRNQRLQAQEQANQLLQQEQSLLGAMHDCEYIMRIGNPNPMLDRFSAPVEGYGVSSPRLILGPKRGDGLEPIDEVITES